MSSKISGESKVIWVFNWGEATPALLKGQLTYFLKTYNFTNLEYQIYLRKTPVAYPIYESFDV